MSRRLTIAFILSACLGCGGPDDPVDALVVVQETNLTACERMHSYNRSVERSCDARDVPVNVCSDHELCEAQLVALTATIAACENTEDVFTTETSQACD